MKTGSQATDLVVLESVPATARRDVLKALAAGVALGPATRAYAAASAMIPQRPSVRVIVDNDFAGDPDGLIALTHQLLTPKARVPLVTTSALNPKLSMPGVPVAATAATGRDIAAELIRRVGAAVPPPVIAGSETFGDGEAQITAAARAIVGEALRPDPLPVFVTCGGPLTNVAAALRLEPRIAARMTVVWIGGGGPDGGWEYNLATDPAAARAVIENSRVPFWQVPQPAYRQVEVSVAELAANLRSLSPLGRWLYDRFTTPPDWIDIGGCWPMGDSPLVLLTSVGADSSHYTERPARPIGADLRYGADIAGRQLRVFDQIDARLVLADFFALMRLHASTMAGQGNAAGGAS